MLLEQTQTKELFRFFLKGNIPPKKNSKRIVTRGRKPPILLSSDKYLSWEKSAKRELLSQIQKPKIPLTWIRIEYLFIFENKRVKDLSNIIESINDLLVVCGIIQDDKWTCLPQMETGARLKKECEDFGVWVQIKEII